MTAVAPRRPVPAAADPAWLLALVWLGVAIYILAVGVWIYHAGMQIRDDTWTNSRTIRFHGDIQNGIRYGTQVLRAAERLANAPGKDGKAPVVKALAAPRLGDKNQRPLTFWELVHGADQVYKDYVAGDSPDGNFGLDYPPLRLMTMTFWTRHIENRIVNFRGWPGVWHPGGTPLYNDKGDLSQLADEDVAAPLLLANTYTVAAAAIFGFLLVWIWVNRGGRPTLAEQTSGWKRWLGLKRLLVPWKPLPLRQTRGLLIFAVTAPAFFYGMVVAENPAPAPPPSVAFAGCPILHKSTAGTVNASVTATIDGQGADAQWHVDWGLTPLYGKQTPNESAEDEDVGAVLRDLPANRTIHYRITASNRQGVTHTNDQTFNTADTLAPMPDRTRYGAVWLSWMQWLGIGLMFIGMAIGLHLMPPWHRAWAAALVAAVLMWLDPATIVDTHMWPQWDVWVLPPFLLAALLGTLDWWFTAGLVLGVGVMFKGQLLIVGPLLAMWPLFGGRWGAAGRIVIGFILAAGLVLSPWLVLDNQPADWSVGPLRWIPAVMAAAVIAAALSFYRRPVLLRGRAIWQELQDEWHGRHAAETERRPATSIFDLSVFCASLLAGIIIITILVLRRWPIDADLPRASGLYLLLGILIPPWFLPRRTMGFWLAAILGASIWMSPYLFHGDWSWKSVGFEYGTRKFASRMALGTQSLGNLPQILETRFGWDIHDTAVTFHPPDIAHALHLGTRGAGGAITGWPHDWGLDGSPLELDIRQFLMMVFVILMAIAGVGAAIQSRRNDPRFLASLVAVWALMPDILCQMAQRYQIFGAAMSCLLIAISPGLTLLHFVMSLIGAGIIGVQLLASDPGRSPQLRDFMQRFGPDDGWITLTIGLIILYVAIAPGRRPKPEELDVA